VRPLLLPIALALFSFLAYFTIFRFSEGGYIQELISVRKTIGIFLLLSLLPSYLLFMMGFLWQRTELVLADLKPMAQPDLFAELEGRLYRLSGTAFVVLLVGVLFGASQNGYFLRRLFDGLEISSADAAMFFGNCILWAVVCLMLCWRVQVSIGISKLGESLDLDIYRLDKLRPLAWLATADFLVVAGALAFMPLQSLDASLDVENYLPGMIVGIPAALALFLLPLWGAHKNIVLRKAERLEQLYAKQDEIGRDNIEALEPIVAHIHRVDGIPNWPIDVQLVTRIFVYAVIAPLAWVCAALVEQLVDAF